MSLDSDILDILEWKGEKGTLSSSFITFYESDSILGGSCEGFFGPKDVFGCQDNVQKVSGGSDAWLRFAMHGTFDDSFKSAFWQWCYKHLFNSKNHQVLKLGDQVIGQ